MKVAVINLSGNVGKTTVAAHLLRPRMGDAPIYSIESVNQDAGADGLAVEQMRGKAFGALLDELMEQENAIVDVGASNVEDFLKLMQRYDGSHDEFDYFVVPVVRERKQQADTVNTLRALAALGIAPAKIRLVMNKFDPDDSLHDSFGLFFALAERERGFSLDERAVIHENEVYELLKQAGVSLGQIAADTVDYRARLPSLVGEDDRILCLRMIALKRLAVTANRNLDEVYEALFAA
jgi:hypothetical protein